MAGAVFVDEVTRYPTPAPEPVKYVERPWKEFRNFTAKIDFEAMFAQEMAREIERSNGFLQKVRKYDASERKR